MPIKSKSFTIRYQELVYSLTSGARVGPASVSPDTHNSRLFVEYNALWDTGSTGSAITHKIVDAFSLSLNGYVRTKTADGEAEAPVYYISLWLPNDYCFPHLRVCEGDLEDCDVLIGMDIIQQGDFAVSNFNGKTTFSFRMPSSGCIDFEKEANIGRALSPKISPNARCHCGSGRKFKNCHGA